MIYAMYEESDLEIIDPLQHIRQRPEMYLVGGDTSADALANRLLLDLQRSSGALVIYQQIGAWRIVGSDQDWLADVADPHEVFQRITTYQHQGQNCFHAEVLLAALASDIVLFAGQQAEVIQGDATLPDQVRAFPDRFPQLVRCLAFLGLR